MTTQEFIDKLQLRSDVPIPPRAFKPDHRRKRATGIHPWVTFLKTMKVGDSVEVSYPQVFLMLNHARAMDYRMFSQMLPRRMDGRDPRCATVWRIK